jgi:hypothetical protein
LRLSSDELIDKAVTTGLWCNGEINRAVGMISHDGDSCPIHESLKGYRTEVKDESTVPVRYITLRSLQDELKLGGFPKGVK